MCRAAWAYTLRTIYQPDFIHGTADANPCALNMDCAPDPVIVIPPLFDGTAALRPR